VRWRSTRDARERGVERSGVHFLQKVRHTETLRVN
jgi:hypothetical protein